MTRATITATRTTGPGLPRSWITRIPGIGWGIRPTWPEAFALAEVLLTYATRPVLPRRTPGATITAHPCPRFGLCETACTCWRNADWPTTERRTPPDTCTDCLTIGDTEPWPPPATNTPTTNEPYATGPPSSATEAPTATPPSASTETAPSPPAHPAPPGTSATGPTDTPSEAPSTNGAIDTKAPYGVIALEQHDAERWASHPHPASPTFPE